MHYRIHSLIMNTENLIKIGLFSDFFYLVTFFNQGLRFVTLRKDYGGHVVSTIYIYIYIVLKHFI